MVANLTIIIPGTSIEKYAAYVDSWNPWSNTTDGYHDKCGHGTSASSAVASPNNKEEHRLELLMNVI